MVMVKFEGNVSASKIRLYFQDLAGKILNSPGAMREAALLVLGSVRQNFVVGGRPVKWKAIGPRWHKRGQRRRRKTGQTEKPLLDTGRLFNSIRVIRLYPDGFEDGTNVSYAQIHQEGGRVDEQVFTNIKIRGHWVKSHKRKDVRIKRHFVKEYNRSRLVIPAHNITARPYLILQEQDKEDIVEIYSGRRGLGL